ncbi:MAG: hypothetical protein IJC51_02665 [Eggerthellaceae bacterium]|nr:hypothetical protein [Eggerthellaceae bacterium]
MKANTVTFTCADGRVEKFSLEFLIERGAIIADKVNGDDISMVMGSANQLWVPGLPAKYFLRDIVKIEFTEEDEVPELPKFEDDGHDYTNRPNVGAKCEYVGHVGQPMTFEGWADDYDKSIIAIEFSLDAGLSWTRFDTPGSAAGRLTMWSFQWVPKEPGAFSMRVRSVNEDGKVSPTPALCQFEVVE